MFQGLISITKDTLRSTENLKKVFEHGVGHKSDPIEQHVGDINRRKKFFAQGCTGKLTCVIPSAAARRRIASFILGES